MRFSLVPPMSGPVGQLDGGSRPRLRLLDLAHPEARVSEQGSICTKLSTPPAAPQAGAPEEALACPSSYSRNQISAIPFQPGSTYCSTEAMHVPSESAAFGLPFTRELAIPSQDQRDRPSDETPSKIANVPQRRRPRELILCDVKSLIGIPQYPRGNRSPSLRETFRIVVGYLYHIEIVVGLVSYVFHELSRSLGNCQQISLPAARGRIRHLGEDQRLCVAGRFGRRSRVRRWPHPPSRTRTARHGEATHNKDGSELAPVRAQAPGQIAGRLEGALDLDSSRAPKSRNRRRQAAYEFGVLSDCALRILAGGHSRLTPSPAGLPPRQRPLAPKRVGRHASSTGRLDH